MPSWFFSLPDHNCVDQLPSLSYHRIFCISYRKCFPEIWVLEEHLTYFLGLDRKQALISRNPLCSRGHQKTHPQRAALSCPGTARHRPAPAELLLPCPLLSQPASATATISLLHAYSTVLAPFILHWTPQIPTKLVLLRRRAHRGKVSFVKDKFVQLEVSISPHLHWFGGLLS